MLPQIAQVVEAQAASNSKRRVRKSALYAEHLAEHATKAEVQQQPLKKSRSDIAANARAAKAKKRSGANPTVAQATSGTDIVVAPPSAPSTQDATLPVALLKSCQVGPASVFGGSPLEGVVPQLATHEPQDADLAAIVDEFCRYDVQTVGSALSRAKAIGVSTPKALNTTFCRLASAAMIGDQAFSRQMESLLMTSGLQLLVYAEGVTYDETPMHTRAAEIIYEASGPHTQIEDAAGVVRPHSAVPRIKRHAISTDVGPSKLFQARTNVAMVVKQAGR